MTASEAVAPVGHVRLEEVTIRYGDHVAVDRASVDLSSPTVGLLGRNGAGKTSVMKALLGLVRPASGRLEVAGHDAQRDPQSVRRLVGYMPEKDAAIPGLNGFETVRLAGQLSGMPRVAAARRAHEVLWLVGLGEQRYRPVSGYSAGMRQKVKLATALVHDPAVLFLDEPTNGLDPDGRREMLALIESLATHLGKAIVLSSHILQDVERVCRSVVVMEGGRIVASGAVGALTAGAVREFDLTCGGLDVAAAESALRLAGIAAERLSGDESRLRVELQDGGDVRPLFAALSARGGTVRRLVERRRSLEQVFLGAVRDRGAS